MPVSAIINTTSNPLADGSLRTPVQTLGQADFLKLLVTQMTQQDPMNPVKDTEFISQMASFSALEQSKTMGQDMAQLRATNLLGQTVMVQDGDSVDGVLTGIVDSVAMLDGKPVLVVDGRGYMLSDVLSVATTPVSALPLTVSPKPMTLPDVIESVAESP
jgi:flagellar basal-body rod modification protein FlgD